MKILRLVTLGLGAALIAGSLQGCSQAVSLEPADDSNNVTCAAQMVRLPDEIEQQFRRSTNAQSTAAWGEPSSVIYRCGITPVSVSSLACVTASDVDWLVDDSNAPSYRFITFARNPATEVIVDSKVISGAVVLDALALAIKQAPASKRCSS